MIIRCPYCEFSRSLNEQSIPTGAEFVTCPKCKHRFKFRSVEKAEEFSIEPNPLLPPVKKDENHADIWDAVDALHQKFEKKMGEHVTDVSVQSSPSSQEQSFDTRDKTPENSQMQDKESPLFEQDRSPKKEDKVPPKQKKKSSKIPSLLEALHLFSHTKPESKYQSPPNKEHTEQKKERSDAPLEQSEQKLQQNLLPLIDNENASNSKTPLIEERLIPQEEHSFPLLKKRKDDLHAQGIPPEEEKNPLLNHIISANSESKTIETFKRISPVPFTPSGGSSPLSVNGDKEKKETAEPTEEIDLKLNAPKSSESIAPEVSMQGTSMASEEPDTLGQSKDSSTLIDDSHTFRPLFPQNSSNNPFELQLDQDLQIPPTPSDRPSKDLGRLDDMDINKNIDIIYGAPIGSTLWESPIPHGWCKSFLHTIRSVMFAAPSFFLKVPANSGISLAFLFFLIQGYITILFSILWAYTAKDLLDIPLLNIALTNLPFLLLLAPLALGFILIFSAGITRLLLELCGARNVPFPLVARIVCYATAPMVLSIIPFIGPLVGALWFFIAMIIAGKRVFLLSWFSSILFTLPATFSIIAGILVFFL